MRRIKEIIIHCSATKEGKDYTVSDIDKWHKRNGWKGIGYHYVVYRDGTIHSGRPVTEIGAHCQGHNANSIGVCYIGGLDSEGNPKDTRTEEQKRSLLNLVRRLKKKYVFATVHGHSEYAAKACPCFDAWNEYREA